MANKSDILNSRNPKVAIIFPTYNASIFMENVLNSINETINYSNYEIVVIDNGGHDDSCEILRKFYPYVKIIKFKKNRGFPGAANTAIRQVYADFYFITTNDVLLVNKNWLNILLSEYKKDPKMGIIAGRLVNIFGDTMTKRTFKKYIELYKNRENNNSIEYVSNLGGAGILINRKIFELVGLFDEGFIPGYYEDTDLCERIRKKGFKLAILNNIKLLHFVSSTFKRMYSKEFVHFYLIPRNRIRFKLIHPTFQRLFLEPFSIVRALAHIILLDSLPTKLTKLKYLLRALKFNLIRKNIAQKI